MSGKFVIINLQRTPLDGTAHLVIRALVDDVMKLLMQKLALQIPPFKINRHVQVKLETSNTGKETISVHGIVRKLQDLVSHDFIKEIKINGTSGNRYTLQEHEMDDDSQIEIELEFYGHYNENAITLTLSRGFLKQYSRYEDSILIHLVNNMTEWESAIAQRFSWYDTAVIDQIKFTQV